MYYKIFLPFIVFLIFQILNFILYSGYNLKVSSYTYTIVLAMYFSCLLAVIFFCGTYNSNKVNRISIVNKSNIKIEILMVFLAIVFLIRPTIVLFGVGFEYGFDYLRENYFTDPQLQKMAYGSNIVIAITNYYVNPILWFYLIFISNNKNRRTQIVFYMLLILLVAFNLSYGGRFFIYFAIFILYLKNILSGNGILVFIKKFTPLIFILITISFLMLLERNINNQKVIESAWLGIYEYHNLPTFLLAQKIDNGVISWENYIFKTPIYSFLSPLFLIFGLSGDFVPYFKYSVILGDFTLYSFYTGNFYNAYATLFAYFYLDGGAFSPLLIFSYISFILFYSKIINDFDVRCKYLCFVCFVLYNSLFMAPIFNPGYVLIIFIFPILYYLGNKVKIGI